MDTSQYFYRNVIFSKQGKTISLVDIDQPSNEREPLEPWLGMVLQLADGQHTIEQLIEFMTTQYNGFPPPNLKETIESVLQRMTDMQLIVLTNATTILPYYLSMPYEMLDIDKAKQLLAADSADMN